MYVPGESILMLPRCGICNFQLLKGDHVIAVEPNGRRLPHYAFDPYNRFSDSTSRINCDNVDYHNTGYEYWDLEDSAAACHAECLRLESSEIPTRAMFQAVAHGYHPTLAEVARRKRWYRSQISTFLHDTLHRFAVPQEIWDLIAEHCCVRSLAAETARIFWCGNSKSPDHSLDISRSVWARFVEFEGVRYIASLTNEPSDHSSSLVHTPGPGNRVGEVIDTLYTSEDYLGVREVLFTSSSSVPSVQYRPGVWWKRLRVPLDCQFEARTDGMKIRSLSPHGAETAYLCTPWGDPDVRHTFALPLSAATELWEVEINFSIVPSRMVSLKCNEPGITAYSVCCYNRVFAMHAHKAGEKDLNYYDMNAGYKRTAVWLYMPVDSDEKIEGLWERSFNDGVGGQYRNDALIVLTSKGRKLVMGPHAWKDTRGDQCYLYVRLTTTDSPTQIYYNTSVFGINFMAFDRTQAESEWINEEPSLWEPSSRCPDENGDWYENYFYTSAKLSDVVEVTPCRADVAGFGLAIIGLLLSYADGREGSLGQVRLDMLDRRIQVTGTTGMRLHFRVSPQGFPNVDSIAFGIEGAQVGEDEFYVPWRGTLEWWFSYWQARVSYEGRSSRATVREKKAYLTL